MNKEDLVVNKSYRHPDFLSDLVYVGDGVFRTYYGIIKANESTIASLIPISEKIKGECYVWVRVRADISPDDHVLDKVFGLNTGGQLYIEKPCSFYFHNDLYKIVKLKATFEEVDDE